MSNRGDVSARLEAEYQMLIPQRLVAEPEIEVNAALQDVLDWSVGRRFNDIEFGLHLHYEIVRGFAPYVGVSWLRRVGHAAVLAREDEEDVTATSLVFGVRKWR